jgi:ABC-2 type transport system permease protein
MRLGVYWDVFKTQLKNNFVREAVYRSNFITLVAVDLVWVFVEFGLFAVLYGHTETLAGWTKPQVFFFLGLYFTTDAVFSALFQRNFWDFNSLVREGELDIVLTKPIAAAFLALTRWMNLTGIFNVALGVAIMIRYAEAAQFAGGWQWLYVPFWVVLGVFIALLIRFFFAVWVFWTERAWTINALYYQFATLATKPHTLYPPLIRYVLLTLLPFAFIGSVPARALTHGITAEETALMVSVIVLFALANRFLWNLGLRRYQSASS